MINGARNLVDGKVLEPARADRLTEDPSTGEATGFQATTPESDIESALARAQRAWDRGRGSFSGAPLGERLRQLRRLAAALDDRAAVLASLHASETGIPISTARLFAGGLAGIADRIADDAPAVLAPRRHAAGGRHVETLRLPWGPAALYPAWNGAAFLAVTKIAYSMAAGCPAVLKPSEYTGATAGVLVDAIQDAELDPGAVQVLCGGPEVGARLAGDSRIRMISYTGGTGGGRAVAVAAIARMAALQLELSASNPAIVLPGADLDLAASELANAMLVLNGQWCEAPRRVFVPRRDHDRLVRGIVADLSVRTVGPALSEATDVGPLAHRRHRDAVATAIRRLGAMGEIVASHEDLPDGGFFVSPTVVCELPLDAVREEIFGPVLAVSPYDRLEDAVDAANGLDDGLAGYVFGDDREAVLDVGRRLHAGEVRLNGARVLDLVDGSAQSFWGTSGIGGHGRTDVLAAHTGIRIVGEEDASLPL